MFFFNFNHSKRGLSEVVGISLLMIIAVFSVLSFQGWFDNFSSIILSDAELKSKSSTDNIFRIDYLKYPYLYLYSSNNISISSILIENLTCQLGVVNSSSFKINISPCYPINLKDKVFVSVVSDSGVFSKYFYIKGSISSTNGNNDVNLGGISSECYSAPINSLGSWNGCNGMLIVDRAMLDNAIANNPINGGEDYYIPYNGVNYTFGNSSDREYFDSIHNSLYNFVTFPGVSGKYNG